MTPNVWSIVECSDKTAANMLLKVKCLTNFDKTLSCCGLVAGRFQCNFTGCKSVSGMHMIRYPRRRPAGSVAAALWVTHNTRPRYTQIISCTMLQLSYYIIDTIEVDLRRWQKPPFLQFLEQETFHGWCVDSRLGDNLLTAIWVSLCMATLPVRVRLTLRMQMETSYCWETVECISDESYLHVFNIIGMKNKHISMTRQNCVSHYNQLVVFLKNIIHNLVVTCVWIKNT